MEAHKNYISRIYVSFDEINFFWVVYDSRNKKLIKNPTKDDLSGTKLRSYNNTNICPICRKENNMTDNSILYPENACRGIDKFGKNTEEWICGNHRRRDYQMYDPNSTQNIIKSLRDCRTGNYKDPRKILGYNCEELTEKWLGAERLSVKYNKYSRLILDHDPIREHICITIGSKLIDLHGKVPQTKGISYNPKAGMWNQNIQNEHGRKFDILIVYCISDNGKTIERIYIFPSDIVLNKNGLGICKNPKDSHGNPISTWYEPYNIICTGLIEIINDIWKEIIKNNK